MHGLGLEHEFLMVNDDGTVEDVDIHKLVYDAIDRIDWANLGDRFSGSWMVKAINNRSEGSPNIRIAYFITLMSRMKSPHFSNNHYHVAFINNVPVNIKYLYIFNGVTDIPPLDTIKVTMKDFDRLSDENLKIMTLPSSTNVLPSFLKDRQAVAISNKKLVTFDKFASMLKTPVHFVMSMISYWSSEPMRDLEPNDEELESVIGIVEPFIEESMEWEYGGFTEVKNLEYKNVKISDVIDYHEDMEHRLIDFFRFMGVSGNISQVPIAKKDGKTVYSGSYHVWFTLPSMPNMTKRESNYHSVNLFQWLEPIIFTAYVANVDSVCKATYRMCGNNIYSGFGSTDPKSLLGEEKTYEEYLKHATIPRDGDQIILKDDMKDKIVMGIGGKPALFVEDSSRLHKVLQSNASKLYFDHINEWSDAPVNKFVGNDIRFASSYMKPDLAMIDDELRLVDTIQRERLSVGSGRIAMIREKITDLEEQEKLLDESIRMAFEVRIFDNAPLDVMKDKIEMMILLFCHAVTIKFDRDRCFNDDNWHLAMAESLYNGSGGSLNSCYMSDISMILDINLCPTLNINEIYNMVKDNLYARYHKHMIYKSFVRL